MIHTFVLQDLWKLDEDVAVLDYWNLGPGVAQSLQFVGSLPSIYFGIAFIQLKQHTGLWPRKS